MWTKLLKTISLTSLFLLVIAVVYATKPSVKVERFELCNSTTNGGEKLKKEIYKKVYACADLEVSGFNYVTFVWIKEGVVIKKRKKGMGRAHKVFVYSMIDLTPGNWRVKLVDENHKSLKEIKFIVDKNNKVSFEGSSMGIIKVLQSLEGTEPEGTLQNSNQEQKPEKKQKLVKKKSVSSSDSH